MDIMTQEIKKLPLKKTMKIRLKKVIQKIALKHPEVKVELVASALEAGLHYVTEDSLTITRKAAGKKFHYFTADGKKIRDKEVIGRINSLAVPPAYVDVRVSADSRSHLQAVGRDARGRKQYRYHPQWRSVRDANKFGRMMAFAQALPQIRKATEQHLKLTGLPREKVLATVVQLLEKTLIRVGNEEYAKENNSFGLTTMRTKHVDISGSEIHFEFKGKSKVHHAIDIQDRRLAKVVRNCQELPGHELFQYVDEAGQRHKIQSDDVNRYLKEITGGDFTAKDFRTWAGTVLAAMALKEVKEYSSVTEAKRNINAAIESVAKKLGNTKTICRKCYVHPEIIEAYMENEFIDAALQRSKDELTTGLDNLKPQEAAVMALLERRMKKSACA